MSLLKKQTKTSSRIASISDVAISDKQSGPASLGLLMIVYFIGINELPPVGCHAIATHGRLFIKLSLRAIAWQSRRMIFDLSNYEIASRNDDMALYLKQPL